MIQKFATIVVLLIAIFRPAATIADSSTSIVKHIISNSNSSVQQPDAMNHRTEHRHEADSTTKPDSHRTIGYRIQVFSDNNPRTAKSEARVKEKNISERFPQYRTYVIYNSPFWRLRVGDFSSEADAYDVAAEIKAAFPAYRKEIRVIKDRINVLE